MLKIFVREKLAAYKTPKHFLEGSPPLRAPNGKADYKAITDYAVSEVTKRT